MGAEGDNTGRSTASPTGVWKLCCEFRSGAALEAVIRVSLRPLLSQEVCHDESGLRPNQEVKSNEGGKVEVRRRRFERKCRLSCRQKSFNLKAAPKARRDRPTLFLFFATAFTSKEADLDSDSQTFLSWEKH